jgi:hypothetical protein
MILKKELRKTLGLYLAMTMALTFAACAVEPEKSKPDFSDPERLNVSEPSFSTAGIRFALNDTRPNNSLWVSVKVGRGSADKDLLNWISLSSVKSGTVSVPFQDCKYRDAGLDSIASANKCEVTIGAKLAGSDKTVYTSYDTPISEVRTALVNAAK